MKKKALAIFDLDGTLTSGNSFFSFIKSTHSRAAIIGNALLLSPFLLFFYWRMYDSQKMKNRVFRALYKGWKKETLEKAGRQFCENTLPQLMRSDVYQRMKWHQQNGHEVTVLTASCSVWLKRWCENENVNLIATELEFENGKATGAILGKNCRGEEKKNRLLAEYNLAEFACIYGYGDHESDSHYIDLAHEQYYISKTPMQWKEM